MCQVHVHAHLYHTLLSAKSGQHVAAHFILLYRKWPKHTHALHMHHTHHYSLNGPTTSWLTWKTIAVN